jgi:hypothetical protein
VSIDALPAVTETGFAVSAAVGGSLTTIATDAVRLVPPVPVHVSENVVSLPSAPVLRLPAAANVPLQPPEAAQEVALAEDQVNVAEPPASIAVLDASRLAVGSAMTGASPPLPPPQAEADRAAITKSKGSLMKSRGELFFILWHSSRAGRAKPGQIQVVLAGSQARYDYVKRPPA